MEIKQQTYIEFVNSINMEQASMLELIKYVSQDRPFYSVKLNGEWYHGLRSREDCRRVYGLF